MADKETGSVSCAIKLLPPGLKKKKSASATSNVPLINYTTIFSPRPRIAVGTRLERETSGRSAESCEKYPKFTKDGWMHLVY